MIKHYCDRCLGEISRVNTVRIGISTSKWDIPTEYELDLCDKCRKDLKTFLKGNASISHGELVQMQKAKESKDERED